MALPVLTFKRAYSRPMSCSVDSGQVPHCAELHSPGALGPRRQNSTLTALPPLEQGTVLTWCCLNSGIRAGSVCLLMGGLQPAHAWAPVWGRWRRRDCETWMYMFRVVVGTSVTCLTQGAPVSALLPFLTKVFVSGFFAGLPADALTLWYAFCNTRS